jgi:localization factor PodJL
MKSDFPRQITGRGPQVIEAACCDRRQEDDAGRGREGRSPGHLRKAADDLHRDLADIDLMLGEALPQSAIQALEGKLCKLADRVDGMGDAAIGVAAPIERKLAETRDALRALIPGESLFGLRQALQPLSHKLDRIGGSDGDSAALSQIASVLAGVRGIGSRVASSAALERLSEDVRCLAGSIELIAKLIEKVAATDAALTRLETIEHRVEGLDLEFQRVSSFARPISLPPIPNMDALAREVGDLRQAQRQTQDSLEAVHGSLGHAIDRLAMIEAEMRGGGSSPRRASAAPAVASAASSAATMALDKESARPEPEGAAANGPQTPSSGEQASPDRHSVEATPPSDFHPTSDSGLLPTRAPSSPADRMLGTETASGASGPSIASGSKLDFIAAARRAVQAAADRQAMAKNHVSTPAEITSTGGERARRVRILGALIGAITVVLMLFGSLQIARTLRSSSAETSVKAPGPAAATQSPTSLVPPASAVAQRKLSAVEQRTPDLATPQPAQ